jgi:hypothetical protein
MIQIVFLGLIAFVHTPTNKPPLYALLVDTTNLWYASNNQVVEHHIPFVAIKKEYWCHQTPAYRRPPPRYLEVVIASG